MPKSFLKFILIIIIIYSVSCSREQFQKVENKKKDWFSFPKINLISKAKPLNSSHQLRSYSIPLYIKDTVSIINSFEHFHSYFGKGIQSFNFSEKDLDSIEIRVDNSSTFDITRPSKKVIAFDTEGIMYDSVIRDTQSVSCYPLYILNNSDSTTALECHESRIVLVQEALDSNNSWKSIEYFHFSGCGSSFNKIPINGKSSIFTTIYKYEGNFKTKLRVKVLSNRKKYLSNEYESTINYSQLSNSNKGRLDYSNLEFDY